MDKTAIHQLIEAQRFAEAARALQAWCRAHRSDPEAFYLLGQTLGQLGRLDEAARAFRRVVELQPGAAVGHGSLGEVCMRRGDFSGAVEHLRRACERLPDDEGYALQLIECLERTGQRQDAFQACYRLLEAKPDAARGHFALGSLCFSAQQYGAAVDHYRRALEQNPELMDAHVGLGKVLTTIGEYDQARPHFEAALERRPDHIETLAGLAILHERCGEPDDTWRLVRQVVDRGVTHTAVATAYTNVCHHFDDCEAAVRYAESTLAALTPEARWERKALHFALGRRYDRMARYDTAFEHYRKGNSQFRINYDPAAHTDLVSRIIHVFSPAYMLSAPRATNRSARPLFIVGMPRSGTSLMEQVLASHPDVAAGGELEFISNTISFESAVLGRNGGFPSGAPRLGTAQLDAIAAEYLAELEAISPDAQRVTDKMPHNFMALGLIAQLFPGARIIHCRRHPLDTCLSIYFQDFTRMHDYATDLEHIGTHYRQYQHLMAHWRNVLDIPLLEVEYRDMVEDQEATVRRVLDFCGLDWHPGCLEFHRNKRRVKTASYAQVSQPVYRRSVERWRNYEPWLDGLKAALERDY